jgi:hypothetical protein
MPLMVHDRGIKQKGGKNVETFGASAKGNDLNFVPFISNKIENKNKK